MNAQIVVVSGVAIIVGVPPKNIKILIILMSIPTKHNMGITNITLVFHLIAPRERERSKKRQKEWKLKLVFSQIVLINNTANFNLI